MSCLGADSLGFSMPIAELAALIKKHSMESLQSQGDAIFEATSKYLKPEADTAPTEPKETEVTIGNLTVYIPHTTEAETDSNRSGNPLAHLKLIPRTTVTPNPYSLNEVIEAGETKPINDMYTERVKPNSDLTGETDDLQDPEASIDLYSQRLKKRK